MRPATLIGYVHAMVTAAPLVRRNLGQSFDQSDGQLHTVLSLHGVKLSAFVAEKRSPWHVHRQEDEIFWVQEGRLTVHFRDHDEILGPGDMLLIPKGIEHCSSPISPSAKVIFVHPETTRLEPTEP